MDPPRGFTPLSRSVSAQIAISICRTGIPFLTDRRIQTKTPTLKRRVLLFGTRGRTRTGTLLRAGDFESPVSTNFTTLALKCLTCDRAWIIAVIPNRSNLHPCNFC